MTVHNDWDPRTPEVLANQLAAYDSMRRRCPVAHSDYLHYSVFRHADVSRILEDETTFSNQASSHVSVPNSIDPPEHTVYRQVIDEFFTPEKIDEFAPICKQISKDLVARLPRNCSVEIMHALAHRYAVHAQCAFLGWSSRQHRPLLHWIEKKNTATLAGDTRAIAAVAWEFDQTIRGILRSYQEEGGSAPDDVTRRLLETCVYGRYLTEEEIVSILRNWTVGELSTLAASVGIIAYFLAEHPDVQDLLRREPDKIRTACDEILRIHGPLLANRRVPTCPVRLGSKRIDAGERVTIMWAAANRDENVFVDADKFRLDRDPELNLLYGKGVHVCPGAELARLEMELITRELLVQTDVIEIVADEPPIRASYPVSGYHRAPVNLRVMETDA